jgi:hypothetical protein
MAKLFIAWTEMRLSAGGAFLGVRNIAPMYVALTMVSTFGAILRTTAPRSARDVASRSILGFLAGRAVRPMADAETIL